jgi:quercetin dioxygenase-like cupin family protein
VELEKARKEAQKLVGPGHEPVTQWLLPVTPRLKQALDFARMESRNLGHDYVGTEHVLLGILDTKPDSVGFQLLANLGIADRMRAEVLRRIPGESRKSPESVSYWPAKAAREIKVGSNSYRIVASGGDTGGAYAAVEAVISSPDGLGWRRHSREDISVYVLEGSIRLRVEERTLELGKGDFVRIPRGVGHEIQASGEPARIMLIATPAGIEQMIGEMGETPGNLREAALRYGVESEPL